MSKPPEDPADLKTHEKTDTNMHQNTPSQGPRIMSSEPLTDPHTTVHYDLPKLLKMPRFQSIYNVVSAIAIAAAFAWGNVEPQQVVVHEGAGNLVASRFDEIESDLEYLHNGLKITHKNTHTNHRSVKNLRRSVNVLHERQQNIIADVEDLSFNRASLIKLASFIGNEIKDFQLWVVDSAESLKSGDLIVPRD